VHVFQVIYGPALIPVGTVLQLSNAQVGGREKTLGALPEPGWYKALAELTFQTGDVVTFQNPLCHATRWAFTPPELTTPVARRPSRLKTAQRKT
jgi:hypothetical protein